MGKFVFEYAATVIVSVTVEAENIDEARDIADTKVELVNLVGNNSMGDTLIGPKLNDGTIGIYMDPSGEYELIDGWDEGGI